MLPIMRLSILLLLVVALLELYHNTDALGIDSKSHGLLSDGRVVRRYGNLGRDSLFNKRYSVRLRGLQERADPEEKDPPAEKDKEDKKEDDKKGDKKEDEKKGDDNKKEDNKEGGDPKGDNNNDNPKAEPKKEEPKEEPQKEPKKEPEPVPTTPSTPEISADEKNPENDPSDTDTTTANQDQAPPSTDGTTPTVPTDMSGSAVAGLASIGGVFVLVAGLFAVSKRRKNKEMTRNIMSNSSKAWEQQNSTYEKMEEEINPPIGSYVVIATYTPSLSDELDIQPGDKVTILVEFDDGWVQGINETRGGTKGVFPRHCVDMDNISSNIYNKRSSSIGGFGERYTEVDLN